MISLIAEFGTILPCGIPSFKSIGSFLQAFTGPVAANVDNVAASVCVSLRFFFQERL